MVHVRIFWRWKQIVLYKTVYSAIKTTIYPWEIYVAWVPYWNMLMLLLHLKVYVYKRLRIILIMMRLS
jgi:hypothetical protein